MMLTRMDGQNSTAMETPFSASFPLTNAFPELKAKSGSREAFYNDPFLALYERGTSLDDLPETEFRVIVQALSARVCELERELWTMKQSQMQQKAPRKLYMKRHELQQPRRRKPLPL